MLHFRERVISGSRDALDFEPSRAFHGRILRRGGAQRVAIYGRRLEPWYRDWAIDRVSKMRPLAATIDQVSA